MNWFSYYFKKSFIFRLLCFVCFVSIIAGIFYFLLQFASKTPQVVSVDPHVVSDDETVIIKGSNFGNPDDEAILHLGGFFISSFNCSSWSNNEITFKVPKNFDSSLLDVSVKRKISTPVMITAKNSLPVISDKQFFSSAPEITSLSVGSASVGEIVSIYGSGFGNSREDSKVVFTTLPENILKASSFSGLEGAFCLESDFDFVNWTDTEIKIRVPDTATTGHIIVSTSFDMSNPVPFIVSTKIGKKTVSNKHTYSLTVETTFSNFRGNKNNSLFVSTPIPTVSYRQKNFELLNINPDAFAVNYQGGIIHKFENLNNQSQILIHQEFSIDTYDVITKVNPVNVSSRVKLKPEILSYTKSNSYIPANDPQIQALSLEITKGRKNPYNNAKLIYNYIVKNIAPKKLSTATNFEASLFSSIEQKSADSHDIAMMFCALARAANIPAVPIAGIMIDLNQKSYRHFWAEFYIDGVGWIPVDPALAMGLPFVNAENDDKNSFGNIDRYHIAFSRGISMQTQMTSGGKMITKPRSYALRKYFEETAGLTAYTSFWSVPKVLSSY